jgi:hypothetical protein
MKIFQMKDEYTYGRHKAMSFKIVKRVAQRPQRKTTISVSKPSVKGFSAEEAFHSYALKFPGVGHYEGAFEASSTNFKIRESVVLRYF